MSSGAGVSTLTRRHESDDFSTAERLAAEFNAPVGLLDPATVAWRSRIGADDGRFPDADATLSMALGRGVLWHGRVTTWRVSADEGRTWLCLPIPRAVGVDQLAVVGFADGPAGVDEGWGPPCPDRALLAWGQSVTERFRGEAFPRSVPGFRAAGGEGQLAAKLLPRMRVSDELERFQKVALDALLSALKVAEVAWVPRSPSEAITRVGDHRHLDPAGLRGLVTEAGEAAVVLKNDPAGHVSSTVRRVAIVAAEAEPTPGWIVALNPIDDRPFSALDAEQARIVASLIASHRSNGRLFGDLKGMLFGIIRALTAAIDAKDPYTSGHSERVARIAIRIAEELGMPGHERGDLYLMGLLHDVGKIGIDDALLKKPGKLTPEEYRVVQSHVTIGVTILSDLKKLQHLMPGVAGHHEAFDGSGYPAGLSGESIPMVARILAVADSFDAMSSTRPYRRPLPSSKIVEIFREGAGRQWDPRIVEALMACRPDVERIRQKGLGQSLVAAVDGMAGKFR